MRSRISKSSTVIIDQSERTSQFFPLLAGAPEAVRISGGLPAPPKEGQGWFQFGLSFEATIKTDLFQVLSHPSGRPGSSAHIRGLARATQGGAGVVSIRTFL